jgi:uncharacterized protein YkwD
VTYSTILVALAASWPLAQQPGQSGAKTKGAPNIQATSSLTELVEAHNRERAREKLLPVKTNPQLEAAALEHAIDMAKQNKMSHEGNDGSTPVMRIERHGYHHQKTGENVAEGQETVTEVMSTWMNSPPHKKNILGDFSEMGAAKATTPDGVTYWCVDFGLPWAKVDAEEMENRFLSDLNRERAKANKPPMKMNSKLRDAARRGARAYAEVGQAGSEKMTRKSFIDKIKKSGYRYRMVAEMAASGVATADEALKTWLEQPTERGYLLGTDFTELGVGVATNDQGIPFWDLIVGRPMRP